MPRCRRTSGPRRPSRFDSAAPISSRVDSRTVAKRQCSAIVVVPFAEHSEMGLGVAYVDDEQHARNYSSAGPTRRTAWVGGDRFRARSVSANPLAGRQRQLGIELQQRHEHKTPAS